MSVIPFPLQEVNTESIQPSRTYRLDFENGRIFSAGSIDGLEAVKQFIKKELLTPRFQFLIYDDQRGSEITQIIIAGDVTPAFIRAEIPRLVRDALSIDNRILEVSNFEFSFDNACADISFTVDTIFGETTVEVVI